MNLETFPSYEVERPGQAVLPTRSRLYALAPVGVGTPLVESLTSYLSRLAQSHGVTVEKLAVTEIAPLIPKSAKMTQDEVSIRSHNLNGIGAWPPLVITALEKLTLRTGLAGLTLSPWRQALAPQALLRPYLAWCPACYASWWQANQTLYTPLLWTLRLVEVCPEHHQRLRERCPFCQKRLRLINSKVKAGVCPACKRWLGLEPASAQAAESPPSGRQLWLAAQLGRLLALAPSLELYPEQPMVALNLDRRLAEAGPGTIQGLARALGLSASPLFGWLKRGHRPHLEILTRICEHLGLSLAEILAPQPGWDYEQLWREAQARPPEPKVEAERLRQRVQLLLDDPHGSPASAAQVARQLEVSLTVLKRHCPTQYYQILQRHEQAQRLERQARQAEWAQLLQASLDSQESPPPSLFEVARRFDLHPRTVRVTCPELCRAISQRRKNFYESRKVQAVTGLQEILAAEEDPPPSLSQVATRLGEDINYLYRNFPELCQAVTRRYHQPPSPPSTSQAPKTPPASPKKAQSEVQLRPQFAALMAVETGPPPSLAEVSRQLGCGLTTLREKCPDLCRQLRQQGDTYRQQQQARVADQLRQILAEAESPPPSVREVAQRVGLEISTLKQWLPELHAELVRRHQAPRQAERQRRQAFLVQMLAENPAPFPSLSQVAKRLGCEPSTLQRQFPEESGLIVAGYRAYCHQERALIQAALEAALADDQPPLLRPIQVARQLGYDTPYPVITYFPELCHQLVQRYEAHRQQVAQAKLAALLTEPSAGPPLTLGAISRQLGYASTSLKYLCPELCQALALRYQSYQAEKKEAVKQKLLAILSGESLPPVSVKAVARAFELPAGAIPNSFPELATAVSAKYKLYLQQQGEQRRQRLDEEVKQLTRTLFQAGIDPKLGRVISRLASPGAARAPHVRRAWEAARQELGLPA